MAAGFRGRRYLGWRASVLWGWTSLPASPPPAGPEARPVGCAPHRGAGARTGSVDGPPNRSPSTAAVAVHTRGWRVLAGFEQFRVGITLRPQEVRGHATLPTVRRPHQPADAGLY